MPTQEEIQRQLQLLDTNRKSLYYLLGQRTMHGGKASAPLPILNGIDEARNNIRHIKLHLRQHGVSVEDDLWDEEPNTSLVIIVEDKIESFNVQEFQERIAKVIKTDPEKVHIPFYTPYNSVRVVVQLDPELAERLISKYISNDIELKRLGIQQVFVEVGHRLAVTIPSQVSYETLIALEADLHRLSQQARDEKWPRNQQDKLRQALAIAASLVYEIKKGRVPTARFYEDIQNLSRLLIHLNDP